MKTVGTFLLLILLPFWAISQIRFVVDAKDFNQDYILVEKPLNGNYFPTTPEKVLRGKKDRFLIETYDENPGFLKINFGNGQLVRVFLEPGQTNSLSVDMDNFDKSLKFDGPQSDQNNFLNEIQREPLNPLGTGLFSARSGIMEDKKPKDYYLDIIDQIDAEKKILQKKNKKKFSEVFIAAMEQDITYYHVNRFMEMVANEYRAFTQNQSSLFTSKWGFYWQKAFDIQPLANVEKAYSEYYLSVLDYYLGDFKLGFQDDVMYRDPDLEIGEQFLEYDRLLWNEFKGNSLEYGLAAILSQRALLGKNEVILFDLFQKYKNDFPSSPFLKNFELAVNSIGESLKEKEFVFPSGIIQLDAAEEINSLDDIINRFKGKVVYLDIWATWCSPCLFEFRQKKPLEEFVQGKDIVLVFVSVDNDDRKEKWQKTIVDNNLKGYHLLANFSLRDELIDKFGDGSNLALPHYSIYDKKGSLVQKEAKQPSHAGVLFNDLMRYID
jgi:thiol-disulfide isomerase/thioredoxin